MDSTARLAATIRMPVAMVIMTDVCLGRRPKTGEPLAADAHADPVAQVGDEAAQQYEDDD